MAVKVFILGRPGSGKSSAGRRIAKLGQHKNWSPVRINDYQILYYMFQRENYQLNSNQKKFRPTEHNGFDVAEFSILDIVLREVEKKVRRHIEEYPSPEQKLILIEFARNDYSQAFEQFSPDFLHDAYFLFIDADINTCIQRVHKRIAHRNTLDDHFVSDDIIRDYYHRDISPDTVSQLVDNYRLDGQRVKIFNNRGSKDSFLREIRVFSSDLFSQSPNTYRKTKFLLGALLSASKATNCPESRKPLEV